MKQHFFIAIESTHPDAESIARRAAEKIACELDWGDDQAGEVDLWPVDENGNRLSLQPLAAWVFEPTAPQTEDDAKECIHGVMVWFGHECGTCMDEHGAFVWKDDWAHRNRGWIEGVLGRGED